MKKNQYRVSFLLVGGQEVHGDWTEMTDKEVEEFRDAIKEFLKNGTGYMALDPFQDYVGQKVEYVFNTQNVAAVRLTYG